MSSGLRSGAGFRMSTAAGQRKWSVAVQRDAGAGGHGAERCRAARWQGGCVWVCVGRQEGMAWHGTVRSPGWLLTGAHRRGCPAFGATRTSTRTSAGFTPGVPGTRLVARWLCVALVATAERGAAHPRVEALVIAPAGDDQPCGSVVSGLEQFEALEAVLTVNGTGTSGEALGKGVAGIGGDGDGVDLDDGHDVESVSSGTQWYQRHARAGGTCASVGDVQAWVPLTGAPGRRRPR